jgi:hypothetical protein
MRDLRVAVPVKLVSNNNWRGWPNVILGLDIVRARSSNSLVCSILDANDSLNRARFELVTDRDPNMDCIATKSFRHVAGQDLPVDAKPVCIVLLFIIHHQGPRQLQPRNRSPYLPSIGPVGGEQDAEFWLY